LIEPKPAGPIKILGAGRAFLPLSKLVTVRVGRRPPLRLQDVRRQRAQQSGSASMHVRRWFWWLSTDFPVIRLGPTKGFEPLACALRARLTAGRAN